MREELVGGELVGGELVGGELVGRGVGSLKASPLDKVHLTASTRSGRELLVNGTL